MIVILDDNGVRHFLKGGEMIEIEGVWGNPINHTVTLYPAQEESMENRRGRNLYQSKSKELCEDLAAQIDGRIRKGASDNHIFVDIPQELRFLLSRPNNYGVTP